MLARVYFVQQLPHTAVLQFEPSLWGNALSDREEGGGGGITARLLIRSRAFPPPHLAWLQIDRGFDLSIFRNEMLRALVHILLSESINQTGNVLQPGPRVPQTNG